MIKDKYVRENPVPERKKSLVKNLSEKIKSSRTVLIASCKNLPSSQFQSIKKKLRGKAEIKFIKKSALNRAINLTEKGALQQLKKELTADFAVFFSELDAFELSGLLTESQVPTKAKAGDIAPHDIEIEPGPTDLIPGPAISELGSVGLKVIVKEGKLEIQKGAVVAKEGEAINEKVAGVLAKLGISPMKVGFIPIAAYDSKEDKVYTGIKIDKEGTLEELRALIGKALGFAVNIKYPAKETISFFIAKASAEEKALKKIIEGKSSGGEEKKEEISEETKPEENQDNSQEDTKEENA